ncbi:uncharacterized protein [Lepeophtheirus salmonis]|uniref:uncharacterized protein isoform X3 n=1 Tax=Lepeophtheirus salmonis TaxID=72036 RepID=UPI003AF39188
MPIIYIIMNSIILHLLWICNFNIAFSTDEYMSCDRFYESKRRARIMDDIPCDMSSSLFCDRKGSSYPEAAMWRFKEENRALMKRMYGDLESTSLYREMRSSKLDNIDPHTIFSSLQYNIRVGSGFKKEPKIIKKLIHKKILSEEKPLTYKVASTIFSEITKSSDIIYTTSSTSNLTTLNEWTNIVSTTLNTPTLYEKLNTTDEKNLTDIPIEDSNTGTHASFPRTTLEPLRFSTENYSQMKDPLKILSEEKNHYEDILPETNIGYDFNGPSVNACPVKEEVLAPFWANNTRDQVLALLNLYPFEQYIHMETCEHENQQFMCNDGCRCEQQYRLHRLLAFDPTNECRGIFSDWFRFPSFCVCKCYYKKKILTKAPDNSFSRRRTAFWMRIHLYSKIKNPFRKYLILE